MMYLQGTKVSMKFLTASIVSEHVRVKPTQRNKDGFCMIMWHS